MAQVKFYSVSSLPNNPDAGGVFFVNGGELYKGASRFGANKVFTVPSTGQDAEGYNLASALTAAGVSAENANAISGDILTGYGAAKVFNGSTWVDLGADVSSIIAQISDSTSTSTANGITVSVTTSDGYVTGVEVAAANISATSVTAQSGTFTNLTVSDTATFNATTVSADTLTVGGTAVNNIAASSATGGNEGVAVTVSTANGGVTDVGVAITSATLLGTLDLTDFAGKDVVTAIGPSSGTGAATDEQVPTALAVAKKLATLDNAMHFREVVASTGAISDPAKGDIVVIGATPATGFVEGQEYIYDGTGWELIGDQRTYAVNAYTSTASVYDGVTNVPGALNAVGAAADTFQAALDAKVTAGADVSDSNKASNLVTAGAVAGYVAQEIGELGTAASKNYADSLTTTGTSLPTESAVASYVTGVVEALDSTPTDAGTDGVSVAVVEADGIITSVTTTVTKATLNTTLGTTNVADKTVATSIGATGADTALATEKAVRDAITDAQLVWLGADGNALT